MNRLSIAVVALSVALAGAFATGCAGRQDTTTTTVETSPPVVASDSPTPAETTTTTTTTTDEPDSVLGATLHAVGTIILFPFRIVGDAIELIV